MHSEGLPSRPQLNRLFKATTTRGLKRGVKIGSDHGQLFTTLMGLFPSSTDGSHLGEGVERAQEFELIIIT